MTEYKATLEFKSRATVYIEAEDQAAATIALKSISEADLRAGTQWRDLFKTLSEFTVVDIIEEG